MKFVVIIFFINVKGLTLMKKIISLFIVCALLCMSLCSCSFLGNSEVITINNNTVIDKEIFTYFLNEAYYSSEGMTQSACIDIATSDCLEYAAVNTQFSIRGGTLSANEKADVSRETNALWRMWGDYLTQIGVSKDTFFKIKQYEYFRKELCYAIYDTDGEKPMNEDYIRQYFTANYVGIKYFYEELYTVLTPEQYNALDATDRAAYNNAKSEAQKRYDANSQIANYVNSNVYTMDEAFMAVTGQVSADISATTAVVGKNDTSFTKEFIDAVFKQPVGSAFIITNADKSYMYFIERVDLLDEKYDFYSQYRDTCLINVSETFFVSEINSWIQSCQAVRHMTEAKQCFNRIKNADRSKYVGTENYIFSSFIPRNQEEIR